MKAELRARSLKEENLTRRRNLVVFQLDQQTCALPIEPIVQIIPMVTITPIPQSNGSLEGVIHVRGTTVPVVNLRHYLGLHKADLQLHTPIILMQNGGGMIGLIVDQVTGVLSLPDEEVTEFVDLLPRELREVPILQGVAHVQDNTVLLLNLDHLSLPHQARALN